MPDENESGINVKEGVDNFLSATQRIFTVSKKPDSQQYWTMVRVTAVGIVILGIIGYTIELVTFLLRATSA